MQAALRRHLPHHPLRMRSGNLFKIMQPSTTTLPHSHPPSPLFHHCHQLDHSIIEKDRNTNIKDNLLFPGEEGCCCCRWKRSRWSEGYDDADGDDNEGSNEEDSKHRKCSYSNSRLRSQAKRFMIVKLWTRQDGSFSSRPLLTRGGYLKLSFYIPSPPDMRCRCHSSSFFPLLPKPFRQCFHIRFCAVGRSTTLSCYPDLSLISTNNPFSTKFYQWRCLVWSPRQQTQGTLCNHPQGCIFLVLPEWGVEWRKRSFFFPSIDY